VQGTSRFAAIFATTALALSATSTANAWTRKTPPLAQVPGGYLYCQVVATSSTPISIVATIVGADGTNVTEFGYGSRTQTSDGFEAEETAGSFDSASPPYYCKAVVGGARRRDVVITLTAFDQNGSVVVITEPR